MPDRRSRRRLRPSRVAVLTLVPMLLAAGACGNEDSSGSGTGSGTDTSLGHGNWLVAVTTAAGNDAELLDTTYVSYNPSTGATDTREVPGVTAGSSNAGLAALLVSTNRKWAIANTTIPEEEVQDGKLTVYPLTDDKNTTLDIRAATGDQKVKAIGWAFDPQQEETLRIVDTRYRVWSVPVTGGEATPQGELPSGKWVFGNEFDPNSGKPYVEGLTSDRTNPQGHEGDDTDPVMREGGTILATDSDELRDLPESTCELSTGFAAADGTTWLLCAEETHLRTYVLDEEADRWKAFGKPSTEVALEVGGMPLVLPPA